MEDVQHLSEKPAANPQATSREFLTFKLGVEEYGIDIQNVQELRGYDNVTRIADAPDYIKGMINLRGNIVPIVDMRIKLNIGAPSYDQFTVVAILNLGRKIVGMVVDSVSDVITLEPEQIRPVPRLGEMDNSNYLIGIGSIDERMLILVDIATLMVGTDLDLGEKIAA